MENAKEMNQKEMVAADKKKDRMGIKMFAWQSSGISQGANVMVMGFFMLYATTILGLSPALVGTITMIR